MPHQGLKIQTGSTWLQPANQGIHTRSCVLRFYLRAYRLLKALRSRRPKTWASHQVSAVCTSGHYACCRCEVAATAIIAPQAMALATMIHHQHCCPYSHIAYDI
eukprot:6180847-Pleurochrysis_carterae.AAC.3